MRLRWGYARTMLRELSALPRPYPHTHSRPSASHFGPSGVKLRPAAPEDDSWSFGEEERLRKLWSRKSGQRHYAVTIDNGREITAAVVRLTDTSPSCLLQLPCRGHGWVLSRRSTLIDENEAEDDVMSRRLTDRHVNTDNVTKRKTADLTPGMSLPFRPKWGSQMHP